MIASILKGENMSNILSEVLTVNAHSLYTPGNHYLGHWTDSAKAVKWFSCREEFASSFFKHDQKTLFFNSGKSIETIAEFIQRFEELVEAGRKNPINRTSFQRVESQPNVVYVNPGPFWLRQPMRTSLFTILLRCASYGYEQNGDFFASLFLNYDLARECKNSILRFLDGYTWYVGDENGTVNGWYSVFGNIDHNHDSAFWKVLIRPKKKS